MSEKRAFVIVGMAGSGKSTFADCLYKWMDNKSIYTINLDPATLNVKMHVDEDIRSKVNYKLTMEEYNLGPNGGIITCLNLYMLNISSIIKSITSDNLIIDTPGQIEAFTWSSPGQVLIDTLKENNYKIFLIYTIDTYYSSSSGVFMSNMIYASSLMSKFQVKTIALFNKIDLSECSTVMNWIKNYESFLSSLNYDLITDTTYHSMALYFEEFYNSIQSVGISSIQNKGREDFFKILDE